MEKPGRAKTTNSSGKGRWLFGFYFCVLFSWFAPSPLLALFPREINNQAACEGLECWYVSGRRDGRDGWRVGLPEQFLVACEQLIVSEWLAELLTRWALWW